MTEAKEADFHFVLGTRQTAVSLFLVVTLTGIFCALAYIAGRAGAPVRAEVSTQPAPEATVPVSAAVASQAPAPVTAPAAPGAYFKQPETGQTFLQVAAADPGVAVVFAEYLTRMDFACQIAEGPDERSYRVLVGPIRDANELATFRSGLEAAGFQPFVRTYR